jgi:hypothetical protein
VSKLGFLVGDWLGSGRLSCTKVRNQQQGNANGSALTGQIAELLPILEGEIRQKSISLRTELAGDVPPILGDRIQLQQVMLNLPPRHSSSRMTFSIQVTFVAQPA